ncbi:MAG: type II toxin-antitoxin system PemK/MazF family toxin [Leptolyngbya sp. Prado105]|jgi:mRNA interferase MazF|nr:type II toxin-antitoxin system PemK/MazF family toxin [Leptolyngbya sp. Prado105]
MNKGDIILVNFPFTDLSQTKLRPALVLWISPNGEDLVVCAITSQNLSTLQPEDFLIEPSDAEFAQTGLRVASKIRLTRIATLQKSFSVRRLGNLGAEQRKNLNARLLQVFQV